MTARKLLLLLLIGSLPGFISAQGPACKQYVTWFYSAGAGTASQPVYWPSSNQTQYMELLQSEYGGAGPVCSAEWIVAATPSGWSGGCGSFGWTCAPPAPVVGGCTTCNQAGQPIDLTNGNTYIQQTDVRIPGLGNGLTLTRTWISNSTGGIFGPKWISNFEETISVGNDGIIQYQRGDGSVWSFAYFGNPASFQLIAPGNVHATLTEQGLDSSGNASWTVNFQNGEKRVFVVNPAFMDQYYHYQNNNGRLVSILDRNGNGTTLAYNMDPNGTFTTLSTVTDAAGRYLYFNYGNGGYVASVTSGSATGINLTYTYGPSISGTWVLTQVTQSDNTFETFTYDANQNITSVNDMNGKVLESHTYDSANRGLSSSRANGVESLTIAYPTSP
jgi:YD repeat-containing protein